MSGSGTVGTPSIIRGKSRGGCVKSRDGCVKSFSLWFCVPTEDLSTNTGKLQCAYSFASLLFSKDTTIKPGTSNVIIDSGAERNILGLDV
jgi:hypothetical protein